MNLLLFLLRHGDARVLLTVDTAKYPRLGNWVLHQRQAYRNEQKKAAGIPLGKNPDRISGDRIAKLDAVGFVWGTYKTKKG